MAKKASEQKPTPERLNKETAEKVFGWKTVHKDKGELIGKKQDKAGRWRKAKVPDFANDQRQACAIEERMKELGRSAPYQKELARITQSKNLPPEWATPAQRSRAALDALKK
jgi:hypothetical protein